MRAIWATVIMGFSAHRLVPRLRDYLTKNLKSGGRVRFLWWWKFSAGFYHEGKVLSWRSWMTATLPLVMWFLLCLFCLKLPKQGMIWKRLEYIFTSHDHLNHHKVLDCVPLWFKALYSQLLGYTAARSIKLFKVIALDYIITALCTST